MPAIRPRPNQILELVRGLHLPLVALDKEHLAVIAEVIGEAWQYLLEHQSQTLASGTEPEISALLVTRLNALLDEHALWQLLVRSVSRGPEMTSFNGAHLEKRPDLAIHLSCRNPSFPLIVECKILDSGTRKGVDTYCDNGLTRFLVGEYAWPAREGFMLAYVRDGSSIAGALSPFLTESQSKQPPRYAIEQMPDALGIQNVDSAQSQHGRAFKYLVADHLNQDPGVISVWHLWMVASGCLATVSSST
jgi:hypothetical protein